MALFLNLCQLRYPFELCLSNFNDLFLFSMIPLEIRLLSALINELTISHFHLVSVFAKFLISLIGQLLNKAISSSIFLALS